MWWYGATGQRTRQVVGINTVTWSCRQRPEERCNFLLLCLESYVLQNFLVQQNEVLKASLNLMVRSRRGSVSETLMQKSSATCKINHLSSQASLGVGALSASLLLSSLTWGSSLICCKSLPCDSSNSWTSSVISEKPSPPSWCASCTIARMSPSTGGNPLMLFNCWGHMNSNRHWLSMAEHHPTLL